MLLRSAVPAGIGAETIPTPYEVTALQRLAGNSAVATLLARRGHGRDAADGGLSPQQRHVAQPVQRAAARGVAEREVAGLGPRPAELPVQRLPARGVPADGQARRTGQGGGVGIPAASPVVQRVLGFDPAEATRHLEEQGWRRTQDGGWTRAPVAEVGESSHGQRPTTGNQNQAAGQDDNITLQVLVRKNASFRDDDFWQRVGHCWVAFYKDDKFLTSAGFYPKVGINEDAPRESVPGEVRIDYDNPKDATTALSVPLTPKQFAKAGNYIKENLGHDYNLMDYNCADFAIGVHKAATGHSPPGRNLLLPNNPNHLHAGIKKHNKKSR
ncbi:hypothetical protein ACFXKW_33735 [Streptomyces sp. NPDC059193]|uniref:hypothetical protein n=1 Tax=Streptomyces sp. NPDC059193 TaxID=3346763 RepID=UPI0036BCF56E